MDSQNFAKVEKRRVKATTKRKKPLDQEAILNSREGQGVPVSKQSEMAGIKSENDGSEEWKTDMWQRNGHMDGSAGPEFNNTNNELSNIVPLSKGSSSDNSMGPLSQSNAMPGHDSSSNELSNMGGGGGGIKTPGSLPPTPSSQHSSQATSQPNSQPPPGSSQQMSSNCIRPSSNMGPNGPIPRGSGRPQSTGIPEGMPNGPGGHFMSQQNQIFVFSTGLANEAAEVVQRGQCRSIVDYHLQHPATRQFLQNFPLGSSNFNRPQSMPPYPDGAMGKFAPKDHQMQFNETGSALANVELWVQQQNASLQEGPFSPSFGPSGNNKQSRSARNNNSGNQRWLPSPNNWMPNNPTPMVGEFGPDPHLQIPGGYMGDPQMPPGRGVLPGPNKNDENLTPEQLARREEQLAQIQKLKHLFFPEKRNEYVNKPMPGMYGHGPPHPGPDGMMGMMRFPPHHPANMMPPPGYFNEMGPQPRMSGPHSPVSPSFSMNRDPSGFFFQGAPPPGMNFPQNGPGPHPPDFHPDFMPDGMNEGMFFGPNGPVGPRMHHGPHDPLAGGPMGPFGPGTTRFPGMCKPKRRRNAAGDKSEDIYRHLQPAPSPQQFCSLNIFEGQELTITRQINLAYQDTPDDQSPSQISFNANANVSQPKKKKKVDNSTRSNEDSKMSVKSEIPCTPDLFSSASSLQSPMPMPNVNSSSAAATPQLPQLNSSSDGSANPENSPANTSNGTTMSESKPIITSLPHCSAPTISKSGPSSGVMSNITSPTLASLAKGVESLSDRIEQDMLQGGLFRTVQMPENDPDVSDEVLPASSQAGNRMRSNESLDMGSNDSNKPGMPEGVSGQNQEFENEKMIMMMKSEASHHMEGPPGVGIDPRPSPNHMFPEMKGHQGMVGNADVRIQARAPNTIQYMPARPPNENNDNMPHPMPPGFNGPDFNGPMIGPDGNPMFDGSSMGPPGFDGPMVSGDMGHIGPGYGNPMHRNFNGPSMGSFGNGQGVPMPGFDPQGPMFEGSIPPGMGGPMMPGFNGPPPPGYNGQGHFVNGPSGPMHPGCLPGFDGPCGPMSDFDGSMPGGHMPGYGNFGPRPMMGGFHGGGGPMGMHNPDMFGGRMPMMHSDLKPNEPMRGKEGTTKKEKDKKKRSESNKKNASAAANQATMNLMNEKNGINMGRGGANKMRPEMIMRMGPDFMGMPLMDGKIRHELMGMGGGAMMEQGMGLRPGMMGGPPDGRIRPGMVRMADEAAFMSMMDGPMMRLSRDGGNFMMGMGGDGPKKMDGPARPGSGMIMMENSGENGMRPGSRSHSDKGMLGPGDGNMRPGSAVMMGLPHEMGVWPGSIMGPPGENRSFMPGMDGMRPDSRLSAMGLGPEGNPVRPTSASMMGMDSEMGMMMQIGDNNARPGSGMINDNSMMPGSNSGDMPMKGGPDNMPMQMRPDANHMRMAGPDVMMGMPGMGPEGMVMVGRGGMGRMMVDMMDPRMMDMEGMVCRNGPMNHRMDPGMMEMSNGEMFSGHMMPGPDRRMIMDPDQFGNAMTFEMMRSGQGFNPHGGGLISGDPAVGMGR